MGRQSFQNINKFKNEDIYSAKHEEIRIDVHNLLRGPRYEKDRFELFNIFIKY